MDRKISARGNAQTGIASAPQSAAAVPAGAGKETEPSLNGAPEVIIEEIGHEPELPPAVENAGVSVVDDALSLPPQVSQAGVIAVSPGQSLPLSTSPPAPAAAVPLSDDQIVRGLHEPLVKSIHWLAAWCIKKLKKAHILLKEVHGRVVRIFVK